MATSNPKAPAPDKRRLILDAAVKVFARRRAAFIDRGELNP